MANPIAEPTEQRDYTRPFNTDDINRGRGGRALAQFAEPFFGDVYVA